MFRVKGLGFAVQGLGVMGQGLGFRLFGATPWSLHKGRSAVAATATRPRPCPQRAP
jgi:hypothetical protein